MPNIYDDPYFQDYVRKQFKIAGPSNAANESLVESLHSRDIDYRFPKMGGTPMSSDTAATGQAYGKMPNVMENSAAGRNFWSGAAKRSINTNNALLPMQFLPELIKLISGRPSMFDMFSKSNFNDVWNMMNPPEITNG